MATFITSFVFAGVLSAYIFLGRGLARQANEESLESRARLALYYFSQDISTAATVAAQDPGVQTSGQILTLNIPGSGVVVYSCDWSLGPTQGILNRQVGSQPVLPLLTNLTSLSFGYYDPTGKAIIPPSSAPTSPQINIKQAYFAFTSVAGVAQSGAQSQFTVVSPRITIKNQGLLKDPNDP